MVMFYPGGWLVIVPLAGLVGAFVGALVGGSAFRGALAAGGAALVAIAAGNQKRVVRMDREMHPEDHSPDLD